MSAPSHEYPYAHPHLSFGDPDLTDHYPPSRTSSRSSRAHPTGDSPPPGPHSRSGAGHSRRQSSSSNETGVARSLAWSPVSGSGSQSGAMPNLSELLDLLASDEDDDHPAPSHQAPPEEEATPRRRRDLDRRASEEEGEAGFRASGAHVPSSSTPRRNASVADERAEFVSPSHAPRRGFTPEPSYGHPSAYNRSTATATSFTLNPVPPRSPSPTGSIIAHEPPRAQTTTGAGREGSRLGPSPALQAGARSVSYGSYANTTGAENFGGMQRQESSEGARTKRRPGVADAMMSPEVSLFATKDARELTRMAHADSALIINLCPPFQVMAEFSAIVSSPRAGPSAQSSSHTPTDLDPPPSRLARLATPTSPQHDPSHSRHAAPTQAPYQQQQQHQQQQRHHFSSYAPQWPQSQQHTHPTQLAPLPNAPAGAGSDPSWVAHELREANRVIAHLQTELSTIRDMVSRLKVEDDVPRTNGNGMGARESAVRSAAREYEGDDSRDRVRLDSHPAAWEIAKVSQDSA